MIGRNIIEDNHEARALALASIYFAGSGHPGGSLSCIDILACLLESPSFFRNGIDKFVLSKGHGCPALYAVAAKIGWIEKSDITLLRKLGSPLQGHPDVRFTPWVEASTGSLGQGFSIAAGMALGFRHQNQQARVYAMLGDGELQEGQVWEAAMFAAHHDLSNLCAIIDYNKLQSDDYNSNIMALEPLRDKWLAFNWHVIEVDGHDVAQIESSLLEFSSMDAKPTVIIAHTIKGKGVSFMEGVPAWHGSVKLRREELEQALRELAVSGQDLTSYLDGSIWGVNA